jgi:hypothetical protein
MKDIIGFIKNYDSINFGFGFWDLPVFIGAVILSFVIFNVISKILHPKIQPYFSKFGNWIFWLFAIIHIVFLLLKAMLTNDYWTILALSIFLIPIFTRIKSIDVLFKIYDDFVDKRIVGK